MKEKNFEKELPEFYDKILHINAKNVKFGLIFNLISAFVLLLMGALAFLFVLTNEEKAEALKSDFLSRPLFTALCAFFFILAMVMYIVLHELVHGLFYKIMTGEKLTFGMSWSCAFCGVPNIYVYRKTALIASSAPLLIFTLIFLPLSIAFYFISPVIYIYLMILFGLHLGGCSGDFYVILLLLFKFKNPKTLVRDTGPEQFFHAPAQLKD